MRRRYLTEPNHSFQIKWFNNPKPMFKRNKTMHRTSLKKLFRQKSPDPDHWSNRVFSSVRAGEKAPRHLSSAAGRAGLPLWATPQILLPTSRPRLTAKLIFISIVSLPEAIDANIIRLPLDIDDFPGLERWFFYLPFPPSSLGDDWKSICKTHGFKAADPFLPPLK